MPAELSRIVAMVPAEGDLCDVRPMPHAAYITAPGAAFRDTCAMPADDATTIKSLPTRIEELALEIAAAIAGSSVFRSSLHDATGTAVWTSGADVFEADRCFVLDALDNFALEPARTSFEH